MLSVRGLLLSLTLTSSVLAGVCSAADLPEASDVRVREPMPGRMMSAAYLNLTNPGTEDKTLVSVTAPWAGLIEIHTHAHENGVMRMRQLTSLTIPAGERVALQPGGLHLMLFKLTLPLPDTLSMTLCYEGDECQDIQAELLKL